MDSSDCRTGKCRSSTASRLEDVLPANCANETSSCDNKRCLTDAGREFTTLNIFQLSAAYGGRCLGWAGTERNELRESFKRQKVILRAPLSDCVFLRVSSG